MLLLIYSVLKKLDNLSIIIILHLVFTGWDLAVIKCVNTFIPYIWPYFFVKSFINFLIPIVLCVLIPLWYNSKTLETILYLHIILWYRLKHISELILTFFHKNYKENSIFNKQLTVWWEKVQEQIISHESTVGV